MRDSHATTKNYSIQILNKMTASNRIRILPAAIPVPLAGLWDDVVDGGIDVAVIVNNICKSRCAHCYNESGPNGGLKIRPDKLRKLIEQGDIQGVPISRIGFSGGEPLLYEDLPELSKRSSSKGIASSCITGSVGIKDEYILALAETGLHRLTLSFDKYHAKFVSEDRISRLANAAADLFPEIAIQISATTIDEGILIAHRLAKIVNMRVEIAVMPLLGIGRAANLTKVNLLKPNRDGDHLHQNIVELGNKVTINFDEWVYANCRIDGFHDYTKYCKIDNLLN